MVNIFQADDPALQELIEELHACALDTTDHAIINWILLNEQHNVAYMAEELGVSATTIHTRLRAIKSRWDERNE